MFGFGEKTVPAAYIAPSLMPLALQLFTKSSGIYKTIHPCTVKKITLPMSYMYSEIPIFICPEHISFSIGQVGLILYQNYALCLEWEVTLKFSKAPV